MSKSMLVGKQLDEYRLDALLGEGGMASVYRALDVRLNRYVAIKVIQTSFRANSTYTMRFEREAQAIAQLQHPNIITLYRFGEQDGMLYMAMQYVDGADLAAVMESFHRDGDFIEFPEVIRIAHELGTALDYAHGHGVIHRDVKPHNIMINRDGRVLLTDFGLALMTEIGTHGDIFGTPHYIAPEQAISSAGVVPQSDLYSMGVVLYELLCGTVPFDAKEPLDIAMMHMSEPVPPPRNHRAALSPAVEQVLLRALAKTPAERYPSGKALAQALEAALQVPEKPVRSSVAHKVSLESAANPLPPLPVAVTPVTAPHSAPQTQVAPSAPLTQQAPPVKPAPSQNAPSNRAGLWVGLALFAVVGVGALGWALTRTSPPQTATPAAIAEDVTAEVSASQTPTLVPTVTPHPTQTALPLPTNPPTQDAVTPVPVVIATLTPYPTTVASAPYALTIRWERDDSVFVSYSGTGGDFPLVGLSLVARRERGSVEGSEWEIAMLQNGQCVAVWKDSGNPRAADENCTLVGERLERKGRERFWRDGVIVRYNGAEIATCERSPCAVEIPR